jgi:NADPH:quinone reductase-like Zn-dependent oxidoreductase
VLRAGNHPQAHFAVPARAREHALNEARFALAKFRRTTLPDTLVARPALHDQLTAGADKRLTVVVGSAGAGKSVLLSSWAQARASEVKSWLSCDRADADPVRFWTGFIEAIRVVTPGFGADAADLLAVNGRMSADVIASIANDAARLPAGSVIIVDDFHAAEAAVLRDMTDLVERWPAETAQLVLSSRSVTRFQAGDEVFGISRGSFAEYAAAQEDKLVRKPARLSFEQAAVVAVSGFAAIKGLRVGRIAAGQKVLIIGASGGVGTYAVQLAKAAGATVTGVASTAKADLVRSIGADAVIDYTREDFADGREHYDLILDIGGDSHLSRLRRALTLKGTLVIAGGEGDRWTGVGRQLRALALSPVVPQRLTMYVSSTNKRQADLEALRQHIESGHVIPIVGKTYPLPEVPEAIRHLEGGRAQGKIAITV